MKHFQSRRTNGRFQRNTLENVFGLRVEVCPHCGSFNPYSVREPKPDNCHACGNSLAVEVEPSPSTPGGRP